MSSGEARPLIVGFRPQVKLIAGNEAECWLRFADSTGHPMPAESIDLSLEPRELNGAHTPSGFQIGTFETDEGVSRARFTVSRAGLYWLHVQLRAGKDAIAGSPIEVVAVAATARAESSSLSVGADGSGILEQPAGSYSKHASWVVVLVSTSPSPCPNLHIHLQSTTPHILPLLLPSLPTLLQCCLLQEGQAGSASVPLIGTVTDALVAGSSSWRKQ